MLTKFVILVVSGAGQVVCSVFSEFYFMQKDMTDKKVVRVNKNSAAVGCKTKMLCLKMLKRSVELGLSLWVSHIETKYRSEQL